MAFRAINLMINNATFATCGDIVEVVERIFQFFYFANKLPKYAHILSK